MINTVQVEAEWHRLDMVAVVPPTNFVVTAPVNATQRHFYGTDRQPIPADVRAQHAGVVSALVASGVTVIELSPTAALPFQFNVRDAGVVIGAEVVLGRMTKAIRAEEPALLRRGLGSMVQVVELTEGRLEGGDLVVTPNEVFVGLSERSDPTGLASLAGQLDDRQLTPVELAPGVLHLDVAMCLLGPDHGVLHRPSISGELPESLRHLDWIELTDAEYKAQAANILVTAPQAVLLDARHERLHDELAARGYRCRTVELTEITKIGGGVRCMTMPLVRT